MPSDSFDPYVEPAPLLPPGFHRMSLAQIKSLCVDPFPGSESRPRLWVQVMEIRRWLLSQGVRGELWIGGSFLSRKLNPNDLDVVLQVSSEVIAHGTPRQRQAVEWLRRSDQWDGHVLPQYAVGHPLYLDGVNDYKYWEAIFGADRTGAKRGIAVIELGGDP